MKYNVSCPSGFPEFGPAEEAVQRAWLRTMVRVFEANGFMPVQTPLVEREENLVAKGGNPKEMYVLKRLLDEDGDDSHSGNALRFDHTVPLALYIARHLNEIRFPFKRYAIGPVFRGERAQKGRYRQFIQCDIDIVGNEALSLLNDSVVAGIIVQIFEELKVGDFVVRMNNRRVLMGFFETLEIPAEKAKDLLGIVDDLEKIGVDGVNKKLVQEGIAELQAKEILRFAGIHGNPKEVLAQLDRLDGNTTFKQGVRELQEVWQGLEAMGLGESGRIQIDLSIARGLDYYTGTVYETILVDSPQLGSVCSGGRYDDLAEVFTGKKLPGVGISIGLTRLLPQLLEAGIIKAEKASPSQVLVVALGNEEMKPALSVGAQLRSAGIATENYLEDKKAAKQFEYADRLGIPLCVVVGQQEVAAGTVQLKNMATGEQQEVPLSDLAKKVQELL